MLDHQQVMEIVSRLATTQNIRRTFLVNAGNQTLLFDFATKRPTIAEDRQSAFRLAANIHNKSPRLVVEGIGFFCPLRIALVDKPTQKIREMRGIVVSTWQLGEQRQADLIEIIQSGTMVEFKVLPPPDNVLDLDAGMLMAFAAGFVTLQPGVN